MATETDTPKKPRRKWDYDSLLENARPYKSLADWQYGDSSAYTAARKRGVQHQIAEALGWAILREHTYETLIESARNFQSLYAWQCGDHGPYLAATRRGLQRQIASELGWASLREAYTYAELLDSAKGFSSSVEWRNGNGAASGVATRRGFVRQIAAELGWNMRNEHTAESLWESARNYSSAREWYQGDGGAYAAACRLGLQRQIAEELGWDVVREHTDETLLESALRFNSLADWQRGDKGAYLYAFKRGLQRKIAEAAGFGDYKGGFDPNKAGVLYYIRVDLVWRAPLYKIGITNYDAATRFYGEQVSITVISETRYENGADARAEEKRLHALYADYRYRGEDRILTYGGDTELFEFDVLGLDLAVAAE